VRASVIGRAEFSGNATICGDLPRRPGGAVVETVAKISARLNKVILQVIESIDA